MDSRSFESQAHQRETRCHVARKPNRRIIGLLGGVGSGKSSVAKILGSLGAEIIDADKIAADCLGDSKIAKDIERSFGNHVIDANGAVDRKALADLVFTDERNRQKLHAIIHPAIREAMRRRLDGIRRRDRNAWIVIDAPLLLESPFRAECDLLVMVDVPFAVRVERVKASRRWSETELKRRESTQASLDEKTKAAHVVIDNAGSLKDLEKRVTEFFTRLNKRS